MANTFQKADRVGFTPIVAQIMAILDMKAYISEATKEYNERIRSNASPNSARLGSMIFSFFTELRPMLMRWIPDGGTMVDGVHITFATLERMVILDNPAVNLKAYNIINILLDTQGVLKIDRVKHINPSNIFAENDEE
jgi:hypothetical protein